MSSIISTYEYLQYAQNLSLSMAFRRIYIHYVQILKHNNQKPFHRHHSARDLVFHVINDLIQLGDLRVSHVFSFQQFLARFLQLG